MTPLSRFSLVLFLAVLFRSQTEARVFEPLPPPPKLAVDEQTVGLWEFSKEAMAKGELPNFGSQGGPGIIKGRWAFVSPEELRPNYPGAGKILGGDKLKASDSPNRSIVTFSELTALQQAPFTVDVLLRWPRGGGLFLKIGAEPNALLMGALNRGPGLFELRVPVKAADGSTKVEVLASNEVFRDVGPIRYDEFYIYSLVFDGKDKFRLLIDGRQAYEVTLPAGKTFLGAKELAVGDVSKWNSVFTGGEIAAVRLSQGARAAAEAGDQSVAFDRKSQRGWIFDAGRLDSPVEPGAIRITKENLFKDGTQPFGWAQVPTGDFDEWYVAGRYAATPEMAFARGEHKVVDALERDGVILPAGEFFRAAVPDGEYWVTVEVGDNRGNSDIASLSANGAVLGENLFTSSNLNSNAIVGRTARGVVRVTNGQGLLVEAKTMKGDGKVPIKSIGVQPYVTLPVANANGRLVWRGKGPAPAAVGLASDAIAKGDLAAAATEARKVEDAFLRANLLACIAGQPKLPEPLDLKIAREIREELIAVLRAEPNHSGARMLYDSNERFRHALNGYLNDEGDEVVYGSRFGVLGQSFNLAFTMRPEDPEYWQGRFIAGASVWQLGTQASAFARDSLSDTYLYPERMKAFAPPGRIFGEVTAAYPEFRIARIMHGEMLPIHDKLEVPANAPKWAVLQHRLLQRILGVLHYWVTERMDERGLLGGGVGDDCEALRWWAVAVTFANDEKAITGWRKMADTAWEMTGGTGYMLTMDDVEHSSEPTADTLSMLGLINYGSDLMPDTVTRLTKIQPIFRDIWTGLTPDGYRMFKGHFVSAKKIEREGDVPYNIRAIRPLLWGAWAQGGKNQELNELIVAYGRSWRDAVMAEFDGKPRGIVPMMIMWDRQRSHAPNGENWVLPGYSSYRYPGAIMNVYDLIFAAYELSGDKSFLEPIQFALSSLRQIPTGDEDAEKYPKGSFDWALRAAAKTMAVAGGSYRFLTDDQSFNDVILRFGPPVTRFQILGEKAGNEKAYAEAMAPVLAKLGIDLGKMDSNPELLTTMVQSTDRIYVTGSLILNAMATGMAFQENDLRGGEIMWPTFQITWNGTDGEVAALVQDASPSNLKVNLYNFAEKAKTLSPRVWRLTPGTYELTLNQTDSDGFATDEEILRQEVKVEAPGQAVTFDLPSRIPAKLTLVKK